MSEQENIKIVQSTWDALNAHDLDKFGQLFAANFRGEQPGAPGLTREQNRAFIQVFLTGFPDLRFTVGETIASGNYVVMHWTAAGTHTGPLQAPSGKAVPPTGKKVTLPGSGTWEVKSGKVTRSWVFWDRATMLDQLGLLPPM
jgi:steroid delta-isomerase-like uncharacterized protein